ncbi:hypothetical protein WA026_001669 [Henosepilachna vigintioctopunctata]|uniref:Cathepsin L n=1 Tax=Henosepilachna vigintioctopunctata TaxID=420089 RepID=A0AAW1ULV3_9CUCU
MKIILFSLVVVVVAANALEEDEILRQWTNFQTTFGKSYRSPVEARKRFSIFKSNLEFIEAHNELYRNGKTTFTMGTNEYADWSDSEFKHYLKSGLLNSTRKAGEIFAKNSAFVAPESVDWRKEGVVTPVKNQKSCGGCWAFSSTGAIEGQYAIKNKQLKSLSEQQLIDCSKNGNNDGCNGGLMTSAFEYVEKNGIDSEDDYPYLEVDGICRSKEFTPVTKLSGYVQIPSEDEDALTEAIATKGPISVGVDASTMAFNFYRSGIYTGPCSSIDLDHAILAVGFGSENGKNYYIVKNSWGSSWGEEGYIRIPRNSGNKCGIATDACYPKL